MKKFISFAPPLLGREEEREVIDTLRSGWITTGPKTELFEKKLRDWVGEGYVVALNSCTAALHLSLVALGISEGDEVITTPFTFASTSHVILYQKAKPVFVDVDPETFNINPALIMEKITPKTKAILPVHYGGHPCDMDEIMEIAKKHKLHVVEDAAHAIGAEYKGRKIGTIGDITCFSFYATKNMTTGEGGAVVAKRKELGEQIRILSIHGISDARRIWKRYAPGGTWNYDIISLGFKYNMMDIQAALGLHQLERLDWFVKRREENFKLYSEVLQDVEEIELPKQRDYVKSVKHLFPILLKGIDRNQFIDELRERGVGASVLFKPLHLHTFYKRILKTKKGDFPIAESIYERLVCLPISPITKPREIKSVAKIVKSLVAQQKRS
jgi:dTDP-4-amino-4,6-dideoxygalactose transaminase